MIHIITTDQQLALSKDLVALTSELANFGIREQNATNKGGCSLAAADSKRAKHK